MKRMIIAIAALVILGCSGGATTPGPTSDNAKRVAQGMSEPEVVAILGEPTDSRSVDKSGMKIKTLVYVADNTLISVFMVNGKADSATIGNEPLFGKIGDLLKK